MKPKDENHVQMIPIESIRIINSRERDRVKHDLIRESIAKVGLKKPIQVSRRSETDEAGYDLVYGEGRLKAFIALGAKEIPAIVVDLPKDERLLRSLVENMARRHHNPLALVREIERLQGLGYTPQAISKKIGVADSFVYELLKLVRAGEERLLNAALTGKVPLSVAIDISKTESPEAQRELLKAYETKKLTLSSLRVVKRLIEQRRIFGKSRGTGPRDTRQSPSADSFVNAYRRETERQRKLVQKAALAEERLLFIITAVKSLFADEDFTTLLRAEDLDTMPEYLAERIKKNTTRERAA
ncbi:MAG: ParB/RepB/Spo0J family partition protein [Chthoniobacter sp.]|nr:ParB/RepB/Spo0J family partition protein [Chthoniobacter sp.]